MNKPSEIWGFADDSIMGKVAVCAVAVFPAGRVGPAEASVAEHLQRVGIPAGTRIHCREMFHADARAKGPWAHVHPSAIESMLERLCMDLKALGDRPLVMTLDLTGWPRELSLPDGRPWTFDEKSIATVAYQYAFGVLGHKYPNAKVRLYYTAARVSTSTGGRQNVWFQSLYKLIEPDEITPPLPPHSLTWVEKR